MRRIVIALLLMYSTASLADENLPIKTASFPCNGKTELKRYSAKARSC